MNPVFPKDVFIPDGEARRMPDGKLYVYGSLDNSGDTEFCSNRYLGFCTEDMLNWNNCGVIFEADTEKKEAGLKKNVTLGAPDCICYKGKYYLYYCTYGAGERVAVADTPCGAFQDIGKVTLADGDSIDPAVMVDDDGSVYYFWGQFSLKGARMKPDMKTLDEDTLVEGIINEQQHGFHEGASIRKRNGKYYLVYTDITRGRATCLSYAVSESPLGPYEKKGVIIDNIGCDSQTWNNHGSIEEFKGQWYVFYHRSSQNSIYNRRLCVEPIFFDEEGLIHEVEMTSSGAGPAIQADGRIDASSACRIRKALPFDHIEPVRIEPKHGNGEVIAYTRDGDWAEYKKIDFKEGMTRVTVSAACPKKSLIEFMIENGEIIGTCKISNTGGWENYQLFTAAIQNTKGIHSLWVNFKRADESVGRMADLNWFQFS